MFIRQLSVSGFRSLNKVLWKPGPLNLLIGPNGSGKSNVLRLLRMLSHAAQGQLSDFVSSEGGIQSLLWDGQAKAITIAVDADPIGGDLGPQQYELKLSPLGLFYGAYRVEEERLGNHTRSDDGRYDRPFYFFLREGETVRVFDETQKKLVVPTFPPAADPQRSQGALAMANLQSDTPGPKHDETILSTAFMVGGVPVSVWSYCWQMQSIAVYHDIRTDSNAEIRKPPVTKLDTIVNADGQNLISVLHSLYTTDRQFKRSIDQAMRAAFGTDYEEFVFPPASDQRIQFRVRWRSLSREQSLPDLSDGTLRFIFLLTVLATSRGRLIAIDEPETGLHPAMFPVIAEFAQEAAKFGQVILTTHSAQFLNAFKEPFPTTTVVRWSSGETSLLTWEGERLKTWLDNYSLGQLFESGELEAGV